MSERYTAPANSESGLEKAVPGRGRVIIVYGLYLGAIMLPLTLPIGAVIAWSGLRRGPDWVVSHLRFQLMTLWLVVAVSALSALLWTLSGLLFATPMPAWILGYLAATLGIAWYVGRCAVGIHRITAKLAISRPHSLLFGG